MDDANVTFSKRLFAWVSPEVHNKAKASAALSNKSFQEWVEQAVVEKLQREGRL